MRDNIYLDIHAIQSVPPSNINRDDTGSPKTARYGGVTRARVSSQSWKKAMRSYFIEKGGLSNVGIRSLEIVRYVAEKIREIDQTLEVEESMELAQKILKGAGVSTQKDFKAKALFFIGSKQAEELARAALAGDTDSKELKNKLKDNPAIDIALFGRMVAEDPGLNEDASCQVAHAISTHSVETEFDFYTATDDFSSKKDAGAGMLGTIEYNSSTLYRYANIAVHEFIKQVKDIDVAINSLKLFVEAFVLSMPTGKINSFANQTLPDAVLINIRKDRPVNLVSAFEIPVFSSAGFVEESILRLKKENEKVVKWVEEPLYNFALGIEDADYNKESLRELLEKLDSSIRPLVEELNGEY